jgi:hypothetical protein
VEIKTNWRSKPTNKPIAAAGLLRVDHRKFDLESGARSRTAKREMKE